VAGRADVVPGATVTLTDADGEVVGSVGTDSDGHYRFDSIGSGTYTVVVGAERMRPEAIVLTTSGNGVLSRDIELLPAAAVLVGTARADGDRAVLNAQITVQDAHGAVTATTHTDENGQYTIANLPEGEYTVVATGYPPVAGRVALSGGTATHDVRLSYEG